MQVNLTRTWVTVSSLLLSFVFVFGNSIKSIYEAVVFLFVVRPFDVGDAVLLGPAQDWCNVRKMLSQCCHVTSDVIVREGAAISSMLSIAARIFSSPAPFVYLLTLPGILSE